MGRGTRRAGRLAAGAALVAVGVLLLAPLPSGRLGMWQGQLLDFGHVPLFAALVLVLRVGLGPPLAKGLIVAVAFAGVAELVQPLVGRSGGWVDFLRGSLGALAAAAAIRAWAARRIPVRTAGYSALALALLVWPVVEVAPFVADTVEGRRAFPVLADFTTDREMLRWDCEQATLTRDPAGARLELFPGPGDFSYALLRPAVADFRSYRWLCCEFRVVGEPVDLVISVRTGMVPERGTTNAQLGRRFAEGEYVARLDLQTLAGRGRPQPLDLADVRYILLFAYKLHEPRTVILSRVWLEP